MNCWICGEIADTREHIHKQTDVRLLFGHGPYQTGKRLQKTDEHGKKHLIQSEDSDHLKYRKSICRYCNSTRTKPYDEAYTEFMLYVNDNSREIIRNRSISLNKVFRQHPRTKSKYLYKYYAKAFGCKLAEHDINVPSEIVQVVRNPKHDPICSLISTFSYYNKYPNKELGLKGFMRSSHLEIESHTDSNEIAYSFSQSIAWFTVAYWYNHIINNRLGIPWCAKAKNILLGQFG